MRIPGTLPLAVATTSATLLISACSAAPHEATEAATTGSTTASASPSPALDPTCRPLSAVLRARVGHALVNNPKQVLEAVAVEAPTSKTGAWLVVAARVGGIRDDGTITDEDAVTNLALVSADDPPRRAKVIEIGDERRDVGGNWNDVSWDRAMRERGETAVGNALACLHQTAG